MTARYVFRMRFRLEPRSGGLSLDPSTFETTLSREADEPGTEGWLFFRDSLWRGKLSDPDHFARLLEEDLDVAVEEVTFRSFHTDDASLAALKDEIAANLEAFNADDVTEVVSKYFGSSLLVGESET